MKYLTLTIAISLGIIGQLLLKNGMNRTHIEMNSIVNIIRVFLTPYVLVGICLYGISTVFYLMTLSKLPLSVAYPAISISYIVIMFLSYLFFHESLNIFKIIGTVLILGGVSLLFIKQ